MAFVVAFIRARWVTSFWLGFIPGAYKLQLKPRHIPPIQTSILGVLVRKVLLASKFEKVDAFKASAIANPGDGLKYLTEQNGCQSC